MSNIILYLFGFLVSVTCGFIAIPIILRYCIKHNLYDTPDKRKVHKNNIPRLGGVCFVPSMLLAFTGVLFYMFNAMPVGANTPFSLWSVIFFIGLVMVYIVGLIDDVVGLTPNVKFLVQTVAAILMPASGLWIQNLHGLFGIYELPFAIGATLTVFIIVFITNAINLIDGIDGLCSCLSLIAISGFIYLFHNSGLHFYCILMAGLVGVIVAFLRFNLFGNAERGMKIFMGDSGSLSLGYILAFLFLKNATGTTSVQLDESHKLLESFSLLIVPVFDVVRVIMLRIRLNKPIFGADKNHIHHRLMQTGLNQHQTLASILLLALFFIAFNLLLMSCVSATIIVILDIIIWTLFHVILSIFVNRHQKSSKCSGN